MRSSCAEAHQEGSPEQRTHETRRFKFAQGRSKHVHERIGKESDATNYHMCSQLIISCGSIPSSLALPPPHKKSPRKSTWPPELAPLAPSLARSIAPSLASSIAGLLARSLGCSLDRWVAHSIARLRFVDPAQPALCEGC